MGSFSKINEKVIGMVLVTREIERQLEKHPLMSQADKGEDAKVVVKFFNPCGSGTWLITEAEKHGDDWLFFGYIHIHTWEWGYVTLSELKNARLPFGLKIERDLYAKGTVKELKQ